MRHFLTATALALGCTRSQAPSPSVDPSARATHSLAASSAASSAAPAAATAPLVAKTRDACAACNGEWAKHGVAEEESCNCRTRDKGKVCRDGRDCSGECIVDPALFEVVDPGP